MLALSRVPQCILSHVPAALLAGSSRHRCMAASSSRTLDELQQSLQQAIAAVAAYQAAHRHVAGLDKLARRVRGDLNASRGSHLPDGVVPDPGLLQGLANNLRGFEGELAALHEAPGVVAVNKTFKAPLLSAALQNNEDSASSSTSTSSSSSGSSSSSDSDTASPPPPGELQVEVDVVADSGLTWIEVKNQELFGLASGHFTGGSHTKVRRGLAEQVQSLLTVAAAPCNRRRGMTPQVVLFFPSGVDGDVAAAIEQLGARVASGRGSLSGVCHVTANSITNLDVTSLCGLVSEASWREPHCEALRAWAARTTHWQDCLAAQQRSPLLPQLQPFIGDDRQLVSSCAAVKQFQLLLNMFAGPLEQARWQQLLQRLHIYHCHCTDEDTGGGGAAAAARSCSSCGAAEEVVVAAEHTQPPGGWFSVSQRLRGVPKLTPLQQAVFGCGDALHGLTLTANASCVRSVAVSSGVELDVHEHRAVWLTGL